MVPPAQLDPTEQDALVKQIGLALLRAAPEDWDRVTVDYRAIGRYSEANGEITFANNTTGNWVVPPDIAAMFAQLRTGMYRDGRGTWYNAKYRLDHPSSYNLDYDRDEPQWNRPPPPQAYADDLQTFPRSEENVPEWLRRRANGQQQPQQQPPRFRVARIFDGQNGNGRPLVNRPSIADGERQELLDYLNSAPVVGPSRGMDIDRLDPDGRPLVPVAFHTDGTWIWPAAVNYYLHTYGISPELELAGHIRRHGGRVPDVDEATRAAAAAFLGRGAPVPPPPGPMRPPVPAGPPLRRPPEAGPQPTMAAPRVGLLTPAPGMDPTSPLGAETTMLAPRPGFDQGGPEATMLAPRPGLDPSGPEATMLAPRPGGPEDPRSPGGPEVTMLAPRPPVVPPPSTAPELLPPAGIEPPAAPPAAALPSQGPPSATIDTLRSRLHTLGVPESTYRIGAPTERAWTMDQTPDGWRVGWYDKEFVAPAMFEDVADAAAFLLGKIMLDHDSPRPEDESTLVSDPIQPPRDGLNFQPPAAPLPEPTFQPPTQFEPLPQFEPTRSEPGFQPPALQPPPPRDDQAFQPPPRDDLGFQAPPPPAVQPPPPARDDLASQPPTQFEPLPQFEPTRSEPGFQPPARDDLGFQPPPRDDLAFQPAPPRDGLAFQPPGRDDQAFQQLPRDDLAFQPSPPPRDDLGFQAQPPTVFEPNPFEGARGEAGFQPPAQSFEPVPAYEQPREESLFQPQRRGGQQQWPIQPIDGEPPLTLFRGKRLMELPPGTEIDRFGNPDGNLTYAAGTPFTARSLVPEWIDRPYHMYRVERPLQVLSGTAIPWFEQAGGGMAYLLPEAVQILLATGSLTEIPGRKPQS
jgi:hypothetical protein